MTVTTAIEFAGSNVPLSSSPINPDWILEGAPVARIRLLYQSRDGTTDTYLWECSAGRFNWYYSVDETVFLIEGSVVVRDETGTFNHLQAGSTIFFPAGSRAEWNVPRYVRKIAFCRTPLTKKIMAVRRVYRGIRRLLGRGSGDTASASMFLGAEAGRVRPEPPASDSLRTD